MNPYTTQLLNQINTKLQEAPLMYFSRDVERALGLENVLYIYNIACIETSYISDTLKKRKKNIFCAEDAKLDLPNKSTLNLINSKPLQDWIRINSKNSNFYAQFFQFSPPVIKVIESLKGKVLNNPANLNRLFEDKISQFKILSDNGLPLPKGFLIAVNQTNYKEITNKLGFKFVVQLDRAHTGSGTFFIRTEDDWDQFVQQYNGNDVKITEMIEGNAYTINGCVTGKGVFIAGLQYQITGLSELTSSEGSTVGNDWSYANELDNDIKNKIFSTTQRIGKFMQSENYKGLFGLDLIVRDNEIFVIEINARQTANISLQTKLELEAAYVPLSLLHLAEFLDIPIEIEPWAEIKPLDGAQIFLRAKNDNFTVQGNLRSGIYRLQSDNSAINWDKVGEGAINDKQKAGVIFADEEQDKPILWQSEGYNVDDLNDGGFLLLIQKTGAVRNTFEELARMQFKNQIVHSGKVSPWIIEALSSIEELIR